MSDIVEVGELGLGVLGVRDVALDVVNGMISVPGGSGAASQAVDLPGASRGVGEGEDLGEAIAHDAGDPNY